jgi:hypothetical protein
MNTQQIRKLPGAKKEFPFVKARNSSTPKNLSADTYSQCAKQRTCFGQSGVALHYDDVKKI